MKPAIPVGVILASVPPTTITSSYPCLMIRYPSPMEWVALAHAVTIAKDSPFAPISIATFPAAILEITAGIYIGATLSAPLSK